MNGYGRFILPTVVVLLALGYLGFATSPPDNPPGGMNLNAFGRLPIVDRGRTKPIDAAARTDLTLLTGKQSFYDAQKTEHSAVEWYLDALTSRKPFGNTAGYGEVIFRIENVEVLSLLNLKPKAGSFRYSLEDMEPKWQELQAALIRADEKKEQERDLFDQKLLELGEHLKIQMSLAKLSTPLLLDPASPTAPPRSALDMLAEWQAAAEAADKQGLSMPNPPPFLVILVAYDKHDAPKFNAAVDAYQKQLAKALPAETTRAGLEADFNDFAPFYHCTLLYVGVFLLTCFSWIAFTKPLNQAAFALAAVTLLVHTGALIMRMYLMNRWGVFVTNLYGTAIFIGWISAMLGFICEALFRNGIGNFVLSVAGFVTMIIAQYLAMGEDTMEMMRAVLDTNFWLATHVTSVNIGYAGTIVAGILGTLFILRGVLTTSLDKTAVKVLGDAMYGVICFATLFSFTGTVLGGIWADQSWGRFWGWDPKENGALLIVVWNALILHARWGGMVKQRGMAVLTLFGNIIVIWSWWGVNMLGVGLHAYANADPAMLTTVLSAVGVHVMLLIVGLLPVSIWRSFQAMHAPVSPAPPSAPTPKPNGRRTGRGATGIMPEPA